MTGNTHEHKLEDWRHIILYAKGHYRKTATIKDLQSIIGRLCGINPEDVGLADILHVVTDLFVKHTSDNQKKDFFSRLFMFDEKVDVKIVIKRMLSYLSVVPVIVDGIEKLHLGDADPEVLPLRA